MKLIDFEPFLKNSNYKKVQTITRRTMRTITMPIISKKTLNLYFNKFQNIYRIVCTTSTLNKTTLMKTIMKKRGVFRKSEESLKSFEVSVL